MEKSAYKPELLAPAGNFEKLEIAIHYGADAVYLAGKNFSLRNFSGNFSIQELYDAVAYAHKHKKKVYLACNVYSRTEEEHQLKTYLEEIGKIGPDAIILSDPGIIRMSQKIIPQIDIHLSTQANTTNVSSARFWYDIGVKRVNLARELSLDAIRAFYEKTPIETEVFVHGAMCISYSGRCLLSSFLSGRDSNRGQCSHPCRWKYSVVEELRPNEYHPLMEDDRGSYIFNSKDLCMIQHLPDLMKTRVTSFKIEGRMKGINYLASVVKTYREAIDMYLQDPVNYTTDPGWLDELFHVFHREYCTGFFFENPEEQRPNDKNVHFGKIHSFIGKILRLESDNLYCIQIRNKLKKTDIIEVVNPSGPPVDSRILALFDQNKEPIAHAHPNTVALARLECRCQPNDIVRKK